MQVLTTGHWPTYKLVDISLPPQLMQCIDVFTTYYTEKTKHRKIKFIHSLGSASVRGKYGKKNYDLSVATLQAAVLVQFNGLDDDALLSFTDLTEMLNIEADVSKRVMHSLSCGKYKVLAKVPPSKSISSKDEFKVNLKFKCQMRKVRIPMASLDETHNPKRVEDDRSIAIEAAIVRIMKARKEVRRERERERETMMC